jgi:hypothetical protein
MTASACATPAARLPTNLTTRHHQIHRWYNFIAGFSPEFVRACIDEVKPGQDGFVLDPFAGAGTTLVEAQLAGLSSVGFEPHPFFADMARAKLTVDLISDDIDLLEHSILVSLSVDVRPDDVWRDGVLSFLRKVVPEGSLSELASCPRLVNSLPARLQPVFRLIVSRTLEGASQSKTDGIYKAPTSTKHALSARTVLTSVCSELREDLARTGDRPEALVIERPAGDEVIQGASLCVTSPPYLNNFDFAEMTRMELYFWGWATSWREITETVRSKLLVNTTTAPAALKGGGDDTDHALTGDLLAATDRLYRDLVCACAGRHKDYHRLVFPYISGLDRVLEAAFHSLNADAPIHVVVADSALYGVHVELHNVVAMILDRHGFKATTVTHLRERGERWILAKRKGPPGKLGEYWVSAVR